MSMNWKADTWAELAANNPENFIKEMAVQKPPRANLLTKTYLECVRQGFDALAKHKNPQYETRFFQALSNLMPPDRSMDNSVKYDVDRMRYLDAKRTPVEFLTWYTALKNHFNPARTIDYHGWLLNLRKPTYDPDNDHAYFSTVNAPAWAASYVTIQRGGSSKDMLSWMRTAPINDSLRVFNAACSLHIEQKPLWLQQCALTLLSRTEDMHREATVYDAITAIRNAWTHPTPESDAATKTILTTQPEGLSLLSHAWFGGHYAKDSYTVMLEWWGRLSPPDRGLMLHRWLSPKTTNWSVLTKEGPKENKPGNALEMFSLLPVELPTAKAKEIVAAAPLEDAQVRQHLSKFIPVLLSAELMVDPANIKSYVLQSWDMLHAKTSDISVEGLFDFEP